MIRCSSATLKFVNSGKLDAITGFLEEYRAAVRAFTERFWEAETKQRFATDSSLESPLSARAKQCAAKQALGIVTGTLKKNEQRKWRLEKLLEEGNFKGAAKLQAVIDKNPSGKPDLKSINAQLDKRFVKIDLSPATKEFDLWITLGSLGTSKAIRVPLKKHAQFNKLSKNGTLRPSIRISDGKVTFFFESVPTKTEAKPVLGIDLGVRSVFSTSDGQQVGADKHGWTMADIQKRLARRKKGSAGFRRAQTHRQNHIGWALKNLNLANVGEVKLEDLKGMRKGKRLSRHLQGWTYRAIVGVVEQKCEERGVRVSFVPRQYTSQRCAACGIVEKGNRRGATYECSCGYVCDADINAAKNISLLSPKVFDSRRSGAYSPRDSKSDPW